MPRDGPGRSGSGSAYPHLDLGPPTDAAVIGDLTAPPEPVRLDVGEDPAHRFARRCLHGPQALPYPTPCHRTPAPTQRVRHVDRPTTRQESLSATGGASPVDPPP